VTKFAAPPGLRWTAAAASLGLCLAGAPDRAFANADFPPYRADQPGTNLRERVPPAAVEPTDRKRIAVARKAEPAKPAPKAAPKPPSGPLIIAVSIGSQHVTVFDNGTPIATAPISSGTKGHLTPMGVFSVIQKERWHRSNLYSNAPMPYMQRITWSGVALHAGVLPGYPASHGCIRLPEEFAIRLWGMTRIGARVVVTRNDATPYEIAHWRLVALATRPPDTAEPIPAAEPSIDGSGNPPAGAAKLEPGNLKTASGTAAVPVERAAAIEKPAELRPAFAMFAAGEQVPIPPVKPTQPSLRAGAISLFVSRKSGKLFVRKGFEPLFDTPIAIARPDVPLGTHIFTAGRPADGGPGLRWLAVSIMNERPAAEPEPVKGKRAREEKPTPPSSEALHRAAAEALDRIELPPEAIERLVPFIAPGASLLISDQGLGEETGQETDFIVVTR